MKKNTQKTPSNFYTKNKELLIVGGGIIALVGAGATWYYLKKKRQKEVALKSSLNELSIASLNISNNNASISIEPTKLKIEQRIKCHQV